MLKISFPPFQITYQKHYHATRYNSQHHLQFKVNLDLLEIHTKLCSNYSPQSLVSWQHTSRLTATVVGDDIGVERFPVRTIETVASNIEVANVDPTSF